MQRVHPDIAAFTWATWLSTRRSWALELDPAFLHNRSLLDRNHLAFHLRKFGRRLLVATDKECRWPKDNDSCGGGDTILGPLTVLSARQRGRSRRNGLSFKCELLTSVALIGDR